MTKLNIKLILIFFLSSMANCVINVNCETAIKQFPDFECEASHPLSTNYYSISYLIKNKANGQKYYLKVSDRGFDFVQNIINTSLQSSLVNFNEKVEQISFGFTDEHVYEVLTYYRHGNLAEFMVKNPDYFKNYKNVIKFADDLVEIMVKLWDSNNIVYGNLKPDTIVMKDDNTPILSDFNFGAVNNTNKRFFGDIYYAAPELVEHGEGEVNRSYKQDIYSIGVLFYYITHKRLPFEGINKTILQQQLAKGDYILDKGVRKDFADIIKKCLRRESDDRVDFKALPQLTLLSKLRKGQLEYLSNYFRVSIDHEDYVVYDYWGYSIYIMLFILLCIIIISAILYKKRANDDESVPSEKTSDVDWEVDMCKV